MKGVRKHENVPGLACETANLSHLMGQRTEFPMASDRIHMRLPEMLAAHVARVVSHGDYETPSEYVRDLIRRDMERNAGVEAVRQIREGYQAIAEGRYFRSTGDFKKDMALRAQRELEGWR
jgi:antitoxin ParD1/3/4